MVVMLAAHHPLQLPCRQDRAYLPLDFLEHLVESSFFSHPLYVLPSTLAAPPPLETDAAKKGLTQFSLPRLGQPARDLKAHSKLNVGIYFLSQSIKTKLWRCLSRDTNRKGVIKLTAIKYKVGDPAERLWEAEHQTALIARALGIKNMIMLTELSRERSGHSRTAPARPPLSNQR